MWWKNNHQTLNILFQSKKKLTTKECLIPRVFNSFSFAYHPSSFDNQFQLISWVVGCNSVSDFLCGKNPTTGQPGIYNPISHNYNWKKKGFLSWRNFTWGPFIGARLCYRIFIELEHGKELENRWYVFRGSLTFSDLIRKVCHSGQSKLVLLYIYLMTSVWQFSLPGTGPFLMSGTKT